jgi:hypothetical protein
MTLDVYAGLFGDDLDAVAERIDAGSASRWRPSGRRRTEGRQRVEQAGPPGADTTALGTSLT